MATKLRIPAESNPVGTFVREEMEARGWNEMDLLDAMGHKPTGRSRLIDECVLEFMFTLDDPCITLGQDTADKLGKAFGTGAELWLNLDRNHREWLKAKSTPADAGDR